MSKSSRADAGELNLVLKEKAQRWNEDGEIQSILADIHKAEDGVPQAAKVSKEHKARLDAQRLDSQALAQKRLPYEQFDQLTMNNLFGVR